MANTVFPYFLCFICQNNYSKNMCFIVAVNCEHVNTWGNTKSPLEINVIQAEINKFNMNGARTHIR